MNLTKKLTYDFRGAGIPTLTGNANNGPFARAVTGAQASVTKNSDGLVLATTNDTQVQNICLFQDNVLALHVDEIQRVEFLVKLTRTSTTVPDLQVAFGLASARNDAIDSITQAVLFRAVGNMNLLLESDNNVVDNDDIPTGFQFPNGGWMLCAIDFASQTRTQAPPFISQGGKSNIALFASPSGRYGTALQRVGENTAFTLEGYTGGLQLFAQIQKASAAANIASLAIREISVYLKDN